MNVTCFGKRVFADVTEIILDSGWALNPVTGVLMRKESDLRHREEKGR